MFFIQQDDRSEAPHPAANREKEPMTKLNEYFDNELSAQEQLEIQMWLAEHGDSPDSEAQLAELFDSLHIDNDAAARAPSGCSTPTASRRRNGSNSRFRTAKWPP